jgi:hypothetical protein
MTVRAKKLSKKYLQKTFSKNPKKPDAFFKSQNRNRSRPKTDISTKKQTIPIPNKVKKSIPQGSTTWPSDAGCTLGASCSYLRNHKRDK